MRSVLTSLASAIAIVFVITAATGAPPRSGSDFFGHSEQGHSVTDGITAPSVLGGFVIDTLATDLGVVEFAPGQEVGGFDSQLHVLQRTTGHVFKIDALGAITPVAEIGMAMYGGVSWPPTFDVFGAYANAMVVGDTTKGIVAVQVGGAATLLNVTQDPGHEISLLCADPIGTFGGAIVAVDVAGWVQIVQAHGTMTPLATGLGTGPYSMAFGSGGAFGADVYIAATAEKKIYRVSPLHPSGEPADVWLDLSASEIAPSRIAISPGGAMGQDILYVVDAGSTGIKRFDADGAFIDTFVDDLPGDASIALPPGGQFADSLVIEVNGCIFVVREAGVQPLRAPHDIRISRPERSRTTAGSGSKPQG